MKKITLRLEPATIMHSEWLNPINEESCILLRHIYPDWPISFSTLESIKKLAEAHGWELIVI